MAKDLGRTLTPQLATDATAAIGIASRRGAGRARRLETATLWLQRHVTLKRLEIKKEKTKDNPADLGTKHLDRASMDRHLRALGFEDVGPISGRTPVQVP